jgi:hypothetical protein
MLTLEDTTLVLEALGKDNTPKRSLTQGKKGALAMVDGTRELWSKEFLFRPALKIKNTFQISGFYYLFSFRFVSEKSMDRRWDQGHYGIEPKHARAKNRSQKREQGDSGLSQG